MDSVLQALARLPSMSESPATGDLDAAPLPPHSGYFAEGRLPLDALQIDVDGIGFLPTPLAESDGQALQALSTPAAFGYLDETRLDPSVRDTGEISADLISLHWAEGAFASLCRDVAQSLGLPSVEAHLHNLMVYGPGQFFKPHQDTEKHPGMVATLVLLWPSAHIGGDLCVRHHGEEVRFVSQHLRLAQLRWAAFYADCRHEVLPVIEGHRVVLSFDLVLPAEPVARRDATASQARAATPPHPALVDALRRVFEPGVGAAAASDASAASASAEAVPLRAEPWVFLLEHDYSERGLGWNHLKGVDRPRVAALRAAAEALGLTVDLALSEIHESWTATVEGRGRHDSRDSPCPDELSDEEITLDHWVDARGRSTATQPLSVSREALVSFSDTDGAFLVDEEYEGYMGNYGETLDYWYRRAALVIRSPEAAAAQRFITDFDGALGEAVAMAADPTASPMLAERLPRARMALHAQGRGRGRSLLPAYAQLAIAWPDAGEASALVATIDAGTWQPADAPILALLEQSLGGAWLCATIRAAASDRMPVHAMTGGVATASLWPQPLSDFVAAGIGAGLGAGCLDVVREVALSRLLDTDASSAASKPAQRQRTLSRRLSLVEQLAAACLQAPSAPAVLDALLRHVLQHPALYDSRELRSLVEVLGPAVDTEPQATVLRSTVQTALADALAPPERPDTDRSMLGMPWICRCADCKAMIFWAESPESAPLVLAMAEPRRQHVTDMLAASGAPVSTQTVKRGSPHQLVLHKLDDWPARRRAQRARWQQDHEAQRQDSS
jgi:hypothetical protein